MAEEELDAKRKLSELIATVQELQRRRTLYTNEGVDQVASGANAFLRAYIGDAKEDENEEEEDDSEYVAEEAEHRGQELFHSIEKEARGTFQPHYGAPDTTALHILAAKEARSSSSQTGRPFNYNY
jgi:hypothetical protein